MTRVKAAVLGGAAALVLLLAFGCSLLQREEPGTGAGWYIQLQIRAPAAKGITVSEFDVTGLKIVVLDPAGKELASIDWAAAQGTKSFLVPVQQVGKYAIKVTHVGKRNGEEVRVAESAVFNIRAMVITVIEVVPGSLGVIRVEGEEPPPAVDLTGYWQMYFTLDEQPELGPISVCIKQTDSNLLAQFQGAGALSGTIDGTNFTLQGLVVEGVQLAVDGTASGDVIGGAASSSMGDGTFRMVPSTLPYGHLDIQGFCPEIPLPLNTEYAIGAPVRTETWYRLGFDLNMSTFMQSPSLRIESNVGLSPGTYNAVPEGSEQPGIKVALWEASVHIASSGTVTIFSQDSNGISGRFDDLIFQEGSITGTFDLIFFGSGQAAVEEGWWHGQQFSATTPFAYSNFDIGSTSSFAVTYWDTQQSAYLWFNIAGDHLEAGGNYTLPNEAWGSLHWSSNTEDFGHDRELDAPGSLHISRYDVNGIAGTYNANLQGGGSISGRFDVGFGEGSF